MQDEQIILLIDALSKSHLRVNISTLRNENVEVINSLTELRDLEHSTGSTIILLEGVLQDSMLLIELQLYSTIFGLKYIILCSDKNNYLANIGLARTYVCDYTKLAYPLLQAAIADDASLEQDVISEERLGLQKIVKNIIAGKTDYDNEVIELARSYQALHAACLSYSNLIKNLRQEHTELMRKNAQLAARERALTDGYTSLLEKISVQNQVLEKYEVALSKDLYKKVNLQSYPNRPQIVYFKEFEALDYSDTFFDTLFNIVRLQLRCNVKLIKLYDNLNCRAIRHLPKSYKIINNKYTSADVAINDFIAKTGSYDGILDNLLTNQVGADILIIIDCKGVDDTVVSGQMLQLNLCRDKSHLGAYGLQPSNTIISGDPSIETDYHCWGAPTTEYSGGDAFAVNSGTKVMQDLSKLIKDYINQTGEVR